MSYDHHSGNGRDPQWFRTHPERRVEKSAYSTPYLCCWAWAWTSFLFLPGTLDAAALALRGADHDVDMLANDSYQGTPALRASAALRPGRVPRRCPVQLGMSPIGRLLGSGQKFVKSLTPFFGT